MANLDQSGVRHLITKIFNAIQDVKNNIPEPMVMVNVTYSELKALRDSNKLTPGCEYRITDYVTTTTQENTISAGHRFDIIVTADSENTLNEIARACNNDEVYITKFWSSMGWDESPRSFSYDGKYVLDGNVYCKYKTDDNFSGELLFDFNDKTKVYSNGEEIRFIPSYYRNEEFGYTDWTSNDIMIVGGGEFRVPFISSIDVYNNEYPEIIESIKKQYDINYFIYAGANLSAWKIWYSLDNDTNRFKWAWEEQYAPFVGYHYDSYENLYEFDTRIQAIAKVCDDSIDDFYETIDSGLDETFSHFGYTNYNGITQLTLYGRTLEDELDYRHNYHYKGIITIDGVEYDSWAQLYYNDGGSTSYATNGNGGNVYILTNRIVAENGKGVIYRMIDEWGNDCPYDFKNIQFKRWLYADGAGVADEESGDFYSYCYTFSYEEETGNIIDASIFGNNGYLLNDGSEIDGVYGNIINKSMYNALQMLNDIVFFSTYGYESGNYYGCYSNTFGYNCVRNTFGTYCHNNTFGNECNDNSFGADCYNNTFGNYCYNNIFGKECYNNDFGIFCYYNTFGTNCYNNTFGNECNDNSFNTDCYNNTFGNNCSDNIFGDTYYYNTFGNGCSYNSFMYHSNDDLIHYVSNINYGDGVSDVILSLKEDEYGFDYGFHLKNISVSKGFNSNGDYIILDANINIAHIIDSNAELTVCYNTHGDVCIFCVADLY